MAKKKKKFKKIINKNKSTLIVTLLILITIGILYFKLGLVPTLIIGLSIMLFLNVIPILKHMLKTKKGKKKLFNTTLATISTLGIVALILTILGTAYIIIAAPSFNPDNLYKKEATILYDKEGEVIARLGTERRELVTFDDLPQVLIDAIVATEDSRYYQHNGFDLPRFIKASVGQLSGNSSAGGASTLSMQVVKNNFTSFDQTLTRKFTDIYLAIFKLEKKYTKEQIIEFYVNTPFLGSRSYGVEQAARTYFGKSVRDLNLAEASLIAGLFQAPGAYDPFINPDRANKRRMTVLNLMKMHGYITEEEREIAVSISMDTLLASGTKSSSSDFQGYIDTVVEEVIDKTENNPYNIPMKIYTNMDRERQTHINKVMRGEIHEFENDVVQTGIAVIESETGHLVAVGANRNNTGERGFNFATMIDRQPGSTVKPFFDYAPGMEYNNWSTYTPFMDIPYKYTSGQPIKNWDGKFKGFMTLREALDQSRNIPAIMAFQQVNNKKIKEFVESIGLNPEVDGGKIHEAHSLGGYNGTNPVELAAAYATFSNGGYYIEPYTVSKIEYRDTKEIEEFKSKINKVMSESTAFMISDILLNSVEHGFNYSLKISGVKVGAKTGTTNFDDETKKRFNLPSAATNDAWVAGFSRDYSVAFWYGYEEISNEYYNTTNRAWRARNGIFKAIGSGVFPKSNKGFDKPSDVIKVAIEKGTVPATLASEYTPDDLIVNEYFKRGTEPTDVSPRFDKVSETISNLDINYETGAYKLTWDAAQTPDYLTEEYFINKYSSFYRDDEYFMDGLTNYMNDNETYLGDFGYNIYTVNEETGELIFVTFTTNNNFNHTTNLVNSKTYVVKPGFSNMKELDGNGSRMTLNMADLTSIIDMTLNGESTVTIKVGDIYQEPVPSVTVLEDFVDVSDQATVTKTIQNLSEGGFYEEIDTSKVATYEIVYTVKYKDKIEEFTRIVIVELEI